MSFMPSAATQPPPAEEPDAPLPCCTITHVPGPGAPQLALGTGNQFPIQEVPVGAASLVESGCRGRDGRVAPLRVLRETATALRLRPPVAGALTCWGQQASFEVELPADKVALYLREINAPAWARGEWVRLQAAGLPFAAPTCWPTMGCLWCGWATAACAWCLPRRVNWVWW